jgi:hypothetical protein
MSLLLYSTIRGDVLNKAGLKLPGEGASNSTVRTQISLMQDLPSPISACPVDVINISPGSNTAGKFADLDKSRELV